MRSLAEQGGGRLDADTVVSEGSWDAGTAGAGSVLEGMARYLGGEALNPVDYIEVDWSEEEWTRGAYGTSYGTGGLTRFRGDLRRAVGPIEWACSDIAGAGHIHMEGAIRMGRRAAEACLARQG